MRKGWLGAVDYAFSFAMFGGLTNKNLGLIPYVHLQSRRRMWSLVEVQHSNLHVQITSNRQFFWPQRHIHTVLVGKSFQSGAAHQQLYRGGALRVIVRSDYPRNVDAKFSKWDDPHCMYTYALCRGPFSCCYCYAWVTVSSPSKVRVTMTKDLS